MLGLAPTKSAANTILETSGIESHTVQLFLSKYAGVIEGRGTQIALERMKRSFNHKIIVLDEASLTSTEQISGLITLSSKFNFKVVMLGDVKQLGSVEAGKPFYYLQEQGLSTVVMNNIMRQRDRSLLSSVYKAEMSVDKNRSEAASAIYASLKSIRRENIIDLSERIKDNGITNQDLATAVYQKWLEHHTKGNDTLIVVPSNPLRKEINSKIRTHYIQDVGIELEILVNKGLRRAEMSDVSNYNIGDVIVFNQKYLEIIDKNQDGILTVKSGPKDKVKEMKTEDLAKKNSVEVLQKDILNLSVGEKIKWTRNSKTHDFVVNGGSAIVKEIQNNKIKIELKNGQIKTLKLTEQDLKHTDHDYSSTTYAAQGKTVDHVIGVMRAKEEFLDLSNQRSFYVAISRGRFSASLVVDNYQSLIKSLSKKSGVKTSAIEHQRAVKSQDFPINLKSYERANLTRPYQATSIKNHQQSSHSHNTNEAHYQSFISNPNLIQTIAIEAFGEVNAKLSKYDQLRFGNKGSVSVNLISGQWYDFSSGEGGSLFKASKERDMADIKTVYPQKTITHKNQSAADKTAIIEKLANKSVPINSDKAQLGQQYLEKHRKIDLSQINLSPDLMFSNKEWSSEDRRFHPSLVAIAHDKDGKLQAAQLIYLDAKTANKNKQLTVIKRSLGHLRGTHVELTTNKKAQNIFIAEGIETALSIAASYPEDRVICSLGISNIRNIELNSEQKNIIICADNDGSDSHTQLVIEKAAYALKAKGATVSIVRPETGPQDFNDVLKESGIKAVKSHIDHILAKPINYHKQLQTLHSQLELYKNTEQQLQKQSCFDVYKDRKGALSTWDKLVKDNGIENATKRITDKPALLGKLKGIDLFTIKSSARIKALSAVHNNSHNLIKIQLNQKLIKLTEKRLSSLQKDFTDHYLSEIGKLKTHDLSFEDLQQKLEKQVTIALNHIHGLKSFALIKAATERIAEQILSHQNRYQKTATALEKEQFLLRSCFEASRAKELAKHLKNDLNPKTTSEHLVFEQKLERLLYIDSRIATKNNHYYQPTSLTASLAELKHNDHKISALTTEHVKRGMSLTKANFMATEIIKYEEKYGVHMSLKHIDHLKTISIYVDHHFNILKKSGFGNQEAKIAYREGAELVKRYDSKTVHSVVAKSDAMSVQATVKQRVENFNLQQNKVIKIARAGLEI